MSLETSAAGLGGAVPLTSEVGVELDIWVRPVRLKAMLPSLG